MTPWIGAFVTYLVLPGCLFLGLGRVLRSEPEEAVALSVISLGLAPLGASWLLTGLLALAPGHGDLFYIGVVLAAFALIALAGIGSAPVRAAFPGGPGKAARPFLIVLAVLGLLLAAQAMILPLNGNDPLEYALVAKVLYADKSLAHYPLRHADPATGLYAGSSHPLGYLSLLVWTALFDGGAIRWLSKSVSPFYTLATIALFLAGRRKDRLLHGALAGLLLLGAPLYFQTSAICHIDSLRLYAMYLSVFCLDRIPEEPGRRRWAWVVLCGLATGMSLFCHSIGLLTLPFLGGCLLWRTRRGLADRLAVLAVITTLALAVGGGRYLRNMATYGLPVRDDEPVWSLPSIDYTGYNDRLKTIVTPVDRLINGVLTPFIRYSGPTDNALLFFGLSFWLAALAVLWRRREVLAESMARDCLICLGIFFVLCLASVLAGSSLIIKNVRYFLTVLPFAAYLGAMPAVALVTAASRLRPMARTLAATGGVLALCGCTLVMQGVTLSFALPNLDALSRGDLAYLRRAYGGEYFYPAGYDAVAFVREHTPPDARILVFRKNEMAYYGGRRILADTDPVLLPFYAATDPETAAQELRELGVTHLFVPNYQPPTFVNSLARELADNPRFGELVFDKKGYRVYRLRREPLPAAAIAAHPLPEPLSWTRPASFVPSLLVELSAPLRDKDILCGRTVVEKTVAVTSSGVYSGPGPLDLPPSATFAPAPIEGGATYRVTTAVHGQGWLKAYLIVYLKGGGLTWDVLFDGVIRGKGGEVSRQVLTPAAACQYRILFVSGARDALTVSGTRLFRLGGPENTPPAVFSHVTAGVSGPQVAGPGETVWLGMKTRPDPGLVARAERRKRQAELAAALRRADGRTGLDLLAQAVIGSGPPTEETVAGSSGRSMVAVSGQGRVDCFLSWDGGAGLTYLGAIAPCGTRGEAVLPVLLPGQVRDVQMFFKMRSGAQSLTVDSASLELP